ncbi:hypothetical protein [Nitrolancea hollandica]|uniref:Uncharacterized protein n=1 Tax=Nitrolancea hollandica Lb TaxID=1129897 RepID=I4EKZ9_9BACT|nr:hypothetical protein [Nitrolancea hollandica]CCF85361.1 hypothetical protein NITHO_4880006 [Nitrolancea hollandica Lb]
MDERLVRKIEDAVAQLATDLPEHYRQGPLVEPAFRVVVRTYLGYMMAEDGEWRLEEIFLTAEEVERLSVSELSKTISERVAEELGEV